MRFRPAPLRPRSLLPGTCCIYHLIVLRVTLRVTSHDHPTMSPLLPHFPQEWSFLEASCGLHSVLTKQGHSHLTCLRLLEATHQCLDLNPGLPSAQVFALEQVTPATGRAAHTF